MFCMDRHGKGAFAEALRAYTSRTAAGRHDSGTIPSSNKSELRCPSVHAVLQKPSPKHRMSKRHERANAASRVGPEKPCLQMRSLRPLLSTSRVRQHRPRQASCHSTSKCVKQRPIVNACLSQEAGASKGSRRAAGSRANQVSLSLGTRILLACTTDFHVGWGLRVQILLPLRQGSNVER
jgi:hypothetical protein